MGWHQGSCNVVVVVVAVVVTAAPAATTALVSIVLPAVVDCHPLAVHKHLFDCKRSSTISVKISWIFTGAALIEKCIARAESGSVDECLGGPVRVRVCV